MNNKKCIKCLQLKELSMFYKDSRTKDGFYSRCKDCHNNICVNYHTGEKFKDYQRGFTRNKYRTSPQFRLEHLVRSQLRQALKTNATSGTAIDNLGCSIPEFRTYIESKFKEGMSWKNLGIYGWHLDHIKPLSLFDLSKQSEFSNASHYTNIQPLWAKENISKGSKFEIALSI